MHTYVYINQKIQKCTSSSFSWQRQANSEDVNEVALMAAVRLGVERSTYYNEDKKTADAVCRAVKPPKSKKEIDLS